MVDVVRALLGEIEALTASGDPPGEHPDIELVVQLRGGQGRAGRDPHLDWACGTCSPECQRL